MTKTHRPWYAVLYIQVLIAIAVGILIGHFWPDLGKAFKPLGDGFISLIKMMIAPVIFCTVVHGKISNIAVSKRYFIRSSITLTGHWTDCQSYCSPQASTCELDPRQ